MHWHASQYDSVAELMKALQNSQGDLWGLKGRPVDREGLARGWGLAWRGTYLATHLFLMDYEISSGDIVHAVVALDVE